MHTSRYEQLERAQAREADRRMVFAALRQRRARPLSRRIFASLMWLLVR